MQDIFPDDAPIAHPADYDAALNGLGGWFTLVIIGLILGVARDIYYIIPNLQYLDPHGQFFVPILTLTIELIIDVACSGVILFFIIKRNIVFRTLFVIRFIAFLLVNITMIAYIGNRFYYAGNWIDFGISLTAAIGWLWYLSSAKRVRNTFIYPKQDYSRNNTFLE